MMGVTQTMWMDICALDDIPVRGSRILKTENGCIALFRTIDNEVFALNDKCPHKEGPLSQGIVHGKSVTCPLHNWVIALDSGNAIGEDGSTSTYDVEIRDTRVHVKLPANAGGA